MLVLGVQPPQFLKVAPGESSPTSPDNFRQLDDVFLQTQTRIWLGEVLRTRLNEQRTIADLLADGELLFEVSKEVWKMMLSKRSELKAYEYEPFASRNSGRYMPYSFVDSFLKMCKILGLDGIDLFSPSDVVEKGDTRKVCMCLRALSKKARSLHLNVPDFDIVTYTIAMPTNMVGYIRRSWELSLSEYSSSSSFTQHQKLRQRSSQEHLNELCGRNYLSVKEFGDSETNSMLQSDSSTTSYSYNSSSVHLDVETQEEDESSCCQQEEVCSSKLDRSFFLHQLDDDNQKNNAASPSVVDSNGQSGGSFLNVERGSGKGYRIYTGDFSILDDKNSIFNASRYLDGDDVEVSSVGSVNSMSIYVRNLDFDDDLEIEESFPEPTNGKLDGRRKKVAERSKSQDIVKHSTLEQILSSNKKEESLKVKGVDIGLSLPKRCIACSDKHNTGCIDPVVPCDKNISKSQINLNVGDEGEELFAAESFLSHGFSQWDQKGKCQIAVAPTGNVGCDALSQSPSLLDSYEQNLLQYSQGEVIGFQHDKINSIVADKEKECSTVMVKSDPDACKQTNGCSENTKDLNISCKVAENRNMEKNEETIQKLQKLAVEAKDGIAQSKPQKRPLLKAVVSGTAVVGATLLLLHFRKNGGEKLGESGKQSNGVRSKNGRNLFSGKEQKALKADGVYPTEKLKL